MTNMKSCFGSATMQNSACSGVRYNRLTTERLRQKYDPHQPRVGAGSPAGGQWLGQNTSRSGTRNGGTGGIPGGGAKPGVFAERPAGSSPNVSSDHPSSLIQPTQFAPAMPAPMPGRVGAAVGVMAAAIQLYNYLSATNSGTTVLEFTSREYAPSAANPFELAMARTLSRSETQSYCPTLGMVQELTDRVDREARLEKPDLSPQQHGTEVHKQVKDIIDANPQWGLKAEQSYLKGIEDVRYG